NLINKYGPVEEILAHAAEIPGRVGELLRANADVARLSKVLATIRRDVPLELKLADLKRSEPDLERTLKLFTKLEFKTLMAKWRKQEQTKPAGEQVSLPLAEADQSLPLLPVATDADQRDLLDRLAKADSLAVVMLLGDDDPSCADWLALGLATDEQAWYIPQ